MQIAISNPNREVLLTLSRAGVIDLIGKEWYFVRVHDAVQVCLQHVQSIKETSKITDAPPGASVENKPSYLQRLLKLRGEELSFPELESGGQQPSTSGDTDSHLEPLLPRKS